QVAGQAEWVAGFHSSSTVEALTVATSPRCGVVIEADTDPPLPGARTWECPGWQEDYVVVGGYFEADVEFRDFDGGRSHLGGFPPLCGVGLYHHPSSGGEDGFVAAYVEGLEADGGGIFTHALIIGGEEDDRVNGV